MSDRVYCLGCGVSVRYYQGVELDHDSEWCMAEHGVGPAPTHDPDLLELWLDAPPPSWLTPF